MKLPTKKSTNAAIGRIIKAAESGRLGAQVNGTCRYELRGKNCSIGALLTPGSLARLKKARRNGSNIASAVKAIGLQRFYDEAGITVRLASTIQGFHDRVYPYADRKEAAKEFVKGLKRFAAGGELLDTKRASFYEVQSTFDYDSDPKNELSF